MALKIDVEEFFKVMAPCFGQSPKIKIINNIQLISERQLARCYDVLFESESVIFCQLLFI